MTKWGDGMCPHTTTKQNKTNTMERLGGGSQLERIPNNLLILLCTIHYSPTPKLSLPAFNCPLDPEGSCSLSWDQPYIILKRDFEIIKIWQISEEIFTSNPEQITQERSQTSHDQQYLSESFKRRHLGSVVLKSKSNSRPLRVYGRELQ